MDYEEEIKRLRRLNMKMYMTMANIITILNERESEELLMKNLNNIKREIIIDEEIKKEELIINELKEKVNYLMLRQKEREERIKKYFTYDSTDSE
jgi:hypothetical protein